MVCGMCPSIFIGKTADGTTVYARYRWGLLSIRLDPREPAPIGGAGGVWIHTKQVDPDELDGCMTFDELKEHTAEVVSWPDELTSRSELDNPNGTPSPGDIDL